MNSLCLFHFCKILRQKVEMHGIFNQLLLREKKSIFWWNVLLWMIASLCSKSNFMLLYPFVHLFYVSILLNVKHPLIWMQNSFNVGLSAKLAHGQNCRKSELLNPRQPSSSLRNRKWILDEKYFDNWKQTKTPIKSIPNLSEIASNGIGSLMLFSNEKKFW